MFIPTFFIAAKIWKQQRNFSVYEEWINKLWSIHIQCNEILYSANGKSKRVPEKHLFLLY